MPDAPQGTVSFLFTDIVGSTRLWEKFPNDMGPALARHDGIVRSAAEAHDGHVFKTVGDAFLRGLSHAARHRSRRRSRRSGGWLRRTGARSVRSRSGWASIPEPRSIVAATILAARHRRVAHRGGGPWRLGAALADYLRAIEDGDKLDGLLFQVARQPSAPQSSTGRTSVPGLGPGGSKTASRRLAAWKCCRHNLPVQTTSFVGREKEIERISRAPEKTKLSP